MNTQNQDTTLKSETLNLLKGLLVAVIFSIGFLVALIIKRKIEPAPIIYYEGIWIIVIMIALLIASSLLLAWLTSNSRTFASYIGTGSVRLSSNSLIFNQILKIGSC
jgi:glucan phosphoethanolaminetransferase (alkaline phosphatase superfamily)